MASKTKKKPARDRKIAAVKKSLAAEPASTIVRRKYETHAARIPPSRLVIAAGNHRQIDTNKPEFIEFMDSIRRHGVVQPIACWQPPGMAAGVYEVIFGARRTVAAGIVDLPDVPVLIYDDIAAAEVAALRGIENMQREDLTLFEEAAQIDELVRLGLTHAEIAAQIGKSVRHITRRLQLARLLPEFAAAHAGQGKRDLGYWSAVMLETVAGLPEEMQTALYKCLVQQEHILVRTERELNGLLADNLRVVKSFPWKPDAALGREPLCTECGQRSDSQPNLFGAEDGFCAKGAVCLNSLCHARKMKLFVTQRAQELREEHPDLVLISGTYDGDREPRFPDEVDSYQVTQVAKTAKGAKPGLIVNGRGRGTVVWIAGASSSRGSGKASRKAQGGGIPLADKKAMVDKRRRRAACQSLIAWVRQKLPKLTAAGLFQTLVIFGTKHTFDSPWNGAGTWALGDHAGDEELRRFAERAVFLVIRQRILVADGQAWHDMEALANCFEFDLAAALTAATAQRPYPKAWAEQAAKLKAGPIPSTKTPAEHKKAIDQWLKEHKAVLAGVDDEGEDAADDEE
jgi:ParB/RepB/Spo0J family partition protein